MLRKKILLPVLAVGLVALAVGLWAFQPWKAFTRSTVDEALPVAATAPVSAPASAPASSAVVPVAPPVEQRELASGKFVDGEHETSGSAQVLRLADGSRVLRLAGFSTSDGPDVHVWFSSATAGGEWGKYDDGRVVKLGLLKGTDGNQNYPIPADAELSGLRSVVIWCDRFNVAFGSAPVDL